MADDRLLITAAAALDADDVPFVQRPAWLLIEDGRIAARGGGAGAARHPPAAADSARSRRHLALDDQLILPALVNAHAHLDLTALGPRPYPGTFRSWLDVVMRERRTDDAAIRESVRDGLRRSRAAGVGWIGDIAASEAAVVARVTAPAESSCGGVSWLECFGIGDRAERGAASVTRRFSALEQSTRGQARDRGVRLDVQPHAPYTAGPEVYARAAELGRSPATHLAETLDEARFVASASGPFAELLESVGVPPDSIHPHGGSPIEALARVLDEAPFVLAHVNYASDSDLDILASRRHPPSVVYCPVASDYFGHRGHRYRDMLARGIRVCLGTDSILCQPPNEAAPLSILAQMRHLWRRDGTDPATLLKMATVHGAAALKLPPGTATLAVGAEARLARVPIDPDDPTPPLRQALAGDELLHAAW